MVLVSIPGTWQRLLLNSIEANPGVAVVETAHGGISAIQSAREHRPDFILIDSSIPIDEAAALISGLKSEADRPRIIALGDTSRQRRLVAQAGAEVVLPSFDFASQLQEIFTNYTP